VIVKQAVSHGDNTVDPDSPVRNPAHPLLHEWASLAFLTEISAKEGLAPKFYGGDRKACLIVYEDLGIGPSLVEPLMGDDPERAKEALRWHAEEVGWLHNATIGNEERFTQIRNELGPPPNAQGGLGWGDLTTLREPLRESFVALDVSPGDGFWDDFQALTEAIAQPGSMRAFVHNDSCPDNLRLLDDGIRLFDFEVAGYHHRFLDAVYARMSMPHCYLANAVPIDVIQATELAYRNVSLITAPQLEDERKAGREIVHACFYWLVSNGIWRVKDPLGDDFTWGISTWRQRVIHRLDALAEACDEFAYMPSVANAARETTSRLRKIWTVDPLPFYPAFRS